MMNQNDQLDRSVSVRFNVISSDVHSLDNLSRESGGKFVYNNLVEICLSFQHYRCETFANYLNIKSSGCLNIKPENSDKLSHSSVLSNQSGDTCLHIIQSLPATPKNDSGFLYGNPQNNRETQLSNHKHVNKTKSQKSSKDFHIFIRKLTCLKKIYSNSTGSKLNCFQSSYKRLSRTKNNSDLNNRKSDRVENTEVTKSNENQFQAKNKVFSKTEIVHCHQFDESVVIQGNSLPKLSNPVFYQEDTLPPISSQNIELLTTSSTNPVKIGTLSSHPYLENRNNLVDTSTYVSQYNTQNQLSNLLATTPQPVCVHSSIEKPAERNVSSVCEFSEPKVIAFASDSHVQKPKPSQLDFRSISDYSFTRDCLDDYLKADVHSLPCCINNALSLKMLDNKSSILASSKQRMPSYVSISRAISGYADYNKYGSEINRDKTILNTLIYPSNVSSNNAQDLSASLDQHEDQVDNFCSLPYEPTQDKISLNQSGKSFLQKKIESLYGPSFADDWRKSRSKNRSQWSSFDKTRSPSCPPNRVECNNNSDLAKPFKKVMSMNNSDMITENADKITNNKRCSSLKSIECTTSMTKTETHKDHCEQDEHWFLNELETQTKNIQQNIDNYQCELANDIPEEIIGKIRAAIGKANLLLNKKFKQFHKLCQDSISQGQDEEFKINCDDLRGYWDMVLIQVADVNKMFDELNQLRLNHWQSIEATTNVEKKLDGKSNRKASSPKHKLNSQRSPSKMVGVKQSPQKDKTASSSGNNREVERKNLLMEIKRKGKIKAREKSDDEIAIFTSTNALQK